MVAGYRASTVRLNRGYPGAMPVHHWIELDDVRVLDDELLAATNNVAELHGQLVHVRSVVDNAQDAFDAAIMNAMARGVKQSTLSKVTGLTEPAIAKAAGRARREANGGE